MTNISNKDRIDWAHAQLHYGNAYMVNVVDESMSNTDTLFIAFKTGATRDCNMIIDFITAVGLKLEVIEAPTTWTTGTGTKRVIYNRNRESSNISLIQEDTTGTFGANMGIGENVTDVTGGTVIRTLYAWSDKKSVSAISRGQREIRLKQNTRYVIKATAVGDANKIQIALDWYED